MSTISGRGGSRTDEAPPADGEGEGVETRHGTQPDGAEDVAPEAATVAPEAATAKAATPEAATAEAGDTGVPPSPEGDAFEPDAALADGSAPEERPAGEVAFPEAVPPPGDAPPASDIGADFLPLQGRGAEIAPGPAAAARTEIPGAGTGDAVRSGPDGRPGSVPAEALSQPADTDGSMRVRYAGEAVPERPGAAAAGRWPDPARPVEGAGDRSRGATVAAGTEPQTPALALAASAGGGQGADRTRRDEATSPRIGDAVAGLALRVGPDGAETGRPGAATIAPPATAAAPDAIAAERALPSFEPLTELAQARTAPGAAGGAAPAALSPSAAPATPFAMPAPGAGNASAAAQVASVIRSGQDGEIEIALSPQELGRVRMVMSHSETGLSVVLIAERTDTLDLLRRHAGQLQDALQQQGRGSVDISFGERGGGDNAQPDRQPARQGAAIALHGPGSAGSRPATASMVGTDRLDLRL